MSAPVAGSDTNSWRHEKESAWLYLQVAAVESGERRQLFERLAATAEEQAAQWANNHQLQGLQFTPSLRARIVAVLARTAGPARIKPVLAAMKLRGLSIYSAQPLTPGHHMPTSVEQVGQRHQGVSGGNLRAAVFGVNDGLVSNAGLVIGVAAANASADAVLTAGIAGLLAGALSMASGEYVSVRSQREMFEYQIQLEKEELDEYPDEEAEELALIYNARGLAMDKARDLSRAMMADPARALDTLAREELGLNPDELGSPWGAAIFSFLAFAAGAALPVVPFALHPDPQRGMASAAAIALVSLALVGLAISLFTGRGAWRSAARMVLIGGGAGVIAYAVGSLLGGVTG
ncbi:MAG: VIT1/CCC1 transporter family protein [Steroidobacteraceae bacterium]